MMMGSVSEEYFLNRFRSQNISEAVERAAITTRSPGSSDALPSHGDRVTECSVPVEVNQIAARRGMTLKVVESGMGTADARLVPIDGGFLVQLKRTENALRLRYTIAHEIGHSLFYDCDGGEPKHQIGIMSRTEFESEERICNRFASSLLVPTRNIAGLFSGIPENSPWTVLHRLEQAAGIFHVSIPAIITRLSTLNTSSSPYTILCFRKEEHKTRGGDARLRVWTHAGLGGSARLYVPSNRTAEGLNVQSVLALFDAWKNSPPSEPIRKCVWDGMFGVAQPVISSQHVWREQVNLSFRHHDRWIYRMGMGVASCLFSVPRGICDGAYVVAVLEPIDDRIREAFEVPVDCAPTPGYQNRRFAIS